MDLFENTETRTTEPSHGPLSDRMRPTTLDEVVGQGHLLGPDKFLKRTIAAGELPSMILWGPPGSGKTTLGNILARVTGADFVTFSAVLCGVKDVRTVIERAKTAQKMGRKTILFVDEIHRFNKAQQDAFLHHVEDGTITLIGATTENPSFEVNPPLLSRCKVLVLEKLAANDIIALLKRAMADTVRGLGEMRADLGEGVMDFIAESADGDARWALNALEASFMINAPNEEGVRHVTLPSVTEALQKKALLYDKGGEEHYNVISAFIKSMTPSPRSAPS